MFVFYANRGRDRRKELMKPNMPVIKWIGVFSYSGEERQVCLWLNPDKDNAKLLAEFKSYMQYSGHTFVREISVTKMTFEGRYSL